LRTVTPRPGSKAAESARILLDETPRLAEADDLDAAVKRLADAAKVSEKAKPWPSQEVYEQVKDAFTDFRDEIRSHNFNGFQIAPEEVEKAVLVGQRFIRVADQAVQKYREFKQQKGALDFQDLLVQARNLLRDHAEVREHVQRRWRYVLIDELQDT